MKKVLRLFTKDWNGFKKVNLGVIVAFMSSIIEFTFYAHKFSALLVYIHFISVYVLCIYIFTSYSYLNIRFSSTLPGGTRLSLAVAHEIEALGYGPWPFMSSLVVRLLCIHHWLIYIPVPLCYGPSVLPQLTLTSLPGRPMAKPPVGGGAEPTAAARSSVTVPTPRQRSRQHQHQDLAATAPSQPSGRLAQQR